LNLNPIVLSIPIFFILIGIELVAERLSHRSLYRLPDAIANLSCGVTSQLSGLFMRLVAIGIYEIVYANFALFTLERNWLYWLILFLLVDLSYYWAHRMSHEINLFWGGHVVHHQSEDFNLSVALRQSSFQVVWTFAFALPIAFLGFDTLDFVLISAINTLYQFWIHTETISRLGWLEHVFNTPSHHRVHHGRDPKYIDKNHAGTLIIWDRMFGTFQQEEEPPTYGITKPINSWNAVWANVSHYAVMLDDIKRISRFSDKVRYVFSKPGWLPADLGGYRPAPEVNKPTYRKFETPSTLTLNYYVLFQYGICLLIASVFLFRQAEISIAWKAVIATALCLWVVNCGVLFEDRPWVRYAEWCRIALVPAAIGVLSFAFSLPLAAPLAAFAYGCVSGVWFYLIVSDGKEKLV
jgi:alkylglycerol monooxygenase